MSARSIGKGVADGCEFHCMPKKDDKAGSCTLTKPNGKEIKFKVDGHDVPYLMEYRETTAVPASIDPAAEDDKAAEESKPKSILKPTGAPVGPPESRNPFEQVAEPIETDYSEVDAEEEQDLRRRGDKAFLMEDAKSLTHLCTHLPNNPCCTSCIRAKVNQKQ